MMIMVVWCVCVCGVLSLHQQYAKEEPSWEWEDRPAWDGDCPLLFCCPVGVGMRVSPTET